MSFTEDSVKTIFGLKLKQLRKERKLSLQNLSAMSGLSVSYLNEIENGRKYPKSDKILALSKAFDIPYDKLVSLKVNRNLEPVSRLMQSDVFNDIPFEAFGIGKENILRLIADAPVKVLAFVNAITEMARNYNMRQEHFHFASLRSYQELNDNYFEEIEEKATRFLHDFGLTGDQKPNAEVLKKLLENRFGYEIVVTDFADYPQLKKFRSVYLNSDGKKLLINQRLSEQQRTFIFGKELGFCYLEMDQRPTTSSWHKAESFEKVLNNFLASYFSGAILIRKNEFTTELENFFSNTKWDADHFAALMKKYNASPEMFMQRLTNILPQEFGLKQLFFIRHSKDTATQKDINKELHLSNMANPLTGNFEEIVYRRWMSKRILGYYSRKKDSHTDAPVWVNAIRSQFPIRGQEYFCISLSRPKLFTDGDDFVTIGFVITDVARRKIRFLDDPNVYFLKTDDEFVQEMIEPEELLRRNELRQRENELKRLAEDYSEQVGV